MKNIEIKTSYTFTNITNIFGNYDTPTKLLVNIINNTSNIIKIKRIQIYTKRYILLKNIIFDKWIKTSIGKQYSFELDCYNIITKHRNINKYYIKIFLHNGDTIIDKFIL